MHLLFSAAFVCVSSQLSDSRICYDHSEPMLGMDTGMILVCSSVSHSFRLLPAIVIEKKNSNLTPLFLYSLRLQLMLGELFV